MKIELLRTCPGRHRDGPSAALELVLSGDRASAEALRAHAPSLGAWIAEQFAALDVPGAAQGDFDGAAALAGARAEPLEDLARCHGPLALWLQRRCGHEADWFALLGQEAGDGVRYGVAFDDHEVCASACALALALIEAFLLSRGIEPAPDGTEHAPPAAALPAAIAAYVALARTKALPRDTAVLLDIARERDIPWMKGDRIPFASLSERRVRACGALRLGYGRHQHVLDGTLCLDRAAHWQPLVDDLEQVYRVLGTLGAPLPEHAACTSPLRARRIAHALGYPVAVRSRARQRSPQRRRADTDAALEAAVREIRERGEEVLVESEPGGAILHIVVAGKRLAAVVGPCGHVQAPRMHEELGALVARIGERLQLGLFTLGVISGDLCASLESGATRVVDLDVAPELDRLVGDPALHREILGAFMDWMFPPGNNGRIPVVAITGTNGKTTTTRMIDAMLRAAGHTTGMACTDGVFIAGQTLRREDSAGSVFHYSVLQDRRISHAVLETARGAIVDFGFAYDACDVAVCTNVTADHLGQFGIETVEDMARLKQSVLRRARRGVVLNADDVHAVAMSQGLAARTCCWVSATQALAELERRHCGGGAGAETTDPAFVVVERIDGREWVVTHGPGAATATPVIAVDAVPASFGGRARHNVSNALQAIAAARLLDVPLEAVRTALATFSTAWENTPGRLNIVRQSPFTAIIDYAHNPDSYRALVAFIDRWPVAGRKVLMVGCPGRASREGVRETAALVAGHFDRFVCRDSRTPVEFREGELSELIREELLRCGVAAEAVTVVAEQSAAVARTLALAQPGDLVVLCTTSSMKDDARRQILAWEPETTLSDRGQLQESSGTHVEHRSGA